LAAVGEADRGREETRRRRIAEGLDDFIVGILFEKRLRALVCRWFLVLMKRDVWYCKSF
jgi:hypothetical protein